MGEIDFKERKLTPFGVIRDGECETDEDAGQFNLKGRCFYFNPKDDFTLLEDDLLVLIGHEYSVIHLRDCLERGTL